jgi:SAM-dependent methyltransferase
MNLDLQKLFSLSYSPAKSDNSTGASSIEGTAQLREHIIKLLKKHSITSMFDAGCNDCNWSQFLAESIEYKGGDISLPMIAHVWDQRPWLDVRLHDATTDPFPNADVLFVRDVAIHLNNQDKIKLWNNWYSSTIPWILITHNLEVDTNTDFEYGTQYNWELAQFPWSPANWEITPWNYPAPVDHVWEYGPNSRSMALWHRDQFRNIL